MEIKTERGLREENKQLTAELEELKGELEHALEKWRIAQGTAMERKKKIEKLEKRLEEMDVNFIRVVHAREVERLQEILDACEAANIKHLTRIDQLEQLCRDLHRGLVYALICAEVPLEGNGTYQDLKQRMEQIGLLDGEQND